MSLKVDILEGSMAKLTIEASPAELEKELEKNRNYLLTNQKKSYIIGAVRKSPKLSLIFMVDAAIFAGSYFSHLKLDKILIRRKLCRKNPV